MCCDLNSSFASQSMFYKTHFIIEIIICIVLKVWYSNLPTVYGLASKLLRWSDKNYSEKILMINNYLSKTKFVFISPFSILYFTAFMVFLFNLQGLVGQIWNSDPLATIVIYPLYSSHPTLAIIPVYFLLSSFFHSTRFLL